MVISEKIIVWHPKATNQLRKAYKYIQKKSPRSAIKFYTEIEMAVSRLSKYPERYPPDKYKPDNDGTYRAFEKYGYRISYRVMKTAIRIVKVRHTAMEPPY